MKHRNMRWAIALAALALPSAPQAQNFEGHLERILALHSQGRDRDALPDAELLLSLCETRDQVRCSDRTSAVYAAGNILAAVGELGRAEPLIREAVSTWATNFPGGVEHRNALDSLGRLYVMAGRYNLAVSPLEEALRLRRASGSPDLYYSLSNTAVAYHHLGLHDRARPLFEEALRVLSASPASNERGLQLATVEGNLAEVEAAQGELTLAETHYRACLAARERLLGAENLDVGSTLNNMAQFYLSLGLLDRAEDSARRALRIYHRQQQPDPPDTAIVLGTLGAVLVAGQHFDTAEDPFDRAIAFEEARTPRNPTTFAYALNNRAALHGHNGDFAAARRLFERARALWTQQPRPNPGSVALAERNLAYVDLMTGHADDARARLQRVLELQVGTFGQDNPELSLTEMGLGVTAVAGGHAELAVTPMRSAQVRYERLLRGMAGVATDARMAALLDSIRNADEEVYSLAALRENDPQAVRLALAVAMLRKGRSVDLAADTARASRELTSAEDRSALDRLRAVRGQIAHALLNVDPGGGSDATQASIEALTAEAARVEEDLARRSAWLRSTRALPGIDDIVDQIARSLPTDGALVEVVRYRPRRFAATDSQGARDAPQYRAFVLTPNGVASTVALGSADVIERASEALLARLRQPSQPAEVEAAALHALTMQRVAPLLGSATRVMLSLDGPLQFVPFGALRSGTSWLAERYQFNYLSSARDLLRAPVPRRTPTDVVMFANPDFGTAPLPRSRGARRATNGDASPLEGFVRLPGAEREADDLLRVFPQAQILRGRAATETALLGVRAPEILVVATHGFYTPVDMEDAADDRMEIGGNAFVAPRRGRLRPDPLAFAGLAMAGAARPRQPSAPGDGARPDGLATALELVGMDLSRTRLAVLSACETGLGGARPGQGVYGLRRAVLLAGAETLVTSLWRVSDVATRELMRDYFRLLGPGGGRVASLHAASAAMRSRHAHPYYWASFIAIGAD